MKKISIIIPVYNEEKLIAKTIEEISNLDLDKEIIVIDDASTDQTPKKLKQLQLKFNFKLLTHFKNQGKGTTLKNGFSKATGFWSIPFDADLEYQAEDIIHLLKEAEKYQSEKIAVYGSRFLAGYENRLTLHYLANRFLTFLTNLLFGLNLTDMETCLKLCPTEILKDLKLASKKFEIEPEITAKLAKRGIKIIEIPIKYSRRGYSQGKKIKFRDGLMAIKKLIKEGFLR